MADTYGLLAQFTFVSSPHAVPGITSDLYRVQFLKRSYTGPVTTIKYGEGLPVELELPNKDDQRFVGLQPQRLTINLIADGTYTPRLLLPDDEFDIQVRYEQVDETGTVENILLHGWLSASNIVEPINVLPYPFTVSATDGLPLLKTRPLLTTEGRYPDGTLSVLDVLRGGLSLTRLGLSLSTVCNIRGNRERAIGQINQDIDTLSRVFLTGEAFRKDGEYQSAADALQAVCLAFRANLKQVNGRWSFVRVNEPLGGFVPVNGGANPPATASYRRVTNAATGVQTSGLVDYVTRVWNDESVMFRDSRIVGIKTVDSVSIAQTFGDPVSVMVNGSFANLTNGFPTGWKIEGNVPQPITRVGSGSANDPFGLRIEGAGTTSRALKSPIVIGAGQAVGFGSAGTKTPMRLKGQFRGFGIRGAKVLIHAIWAGDTGPFANWALLAQDGRWLTNPNRGQLNALEIFHFNTANPSTGVYIPATKSGWGDIDIALPVGPFPIKEVQVYLCQGTRLLRIGSDGKETTSPLSPYPVNPFIIYRDMTLSIGDEQRKTLGQTWKVINRFKQDNDGTLEQPTAPTHTLTVGDLPTFPAEKTTHSLLQQADGLTFPSYRFGHPRSPLAGNTGRPLALLFAEEEAAQGLKVAGRLEGQLIGKLPHGPDTIIHLTGQPGVSGADSFYQIVGWKYNARFQTHDITAIEILRQGAPRRIEGSYQTADGDVPFDVDPAFGQDPSYVTIADPLPIKSKTKVGSYTQDDIIDIIRGKVVDPVLLNGGIGSSLSDTTPLTTTEKQTGGTVRVYNGPELITSTTLTGREIVQLLTLS